LYARIGIHLAGESASVSIAAHPLGTDLIFAATASAIPSCASDASKLTPQAAPRAALGQAIEDAASSSSLTPAAVEISGFATADGTARTTLTVASGASLAGMTWDEAMTASSGG
jgi:hypothetical protein